MKMKLLQFVLLAIAMTFYLGPYNAAYGEEEHRHERHNGDSSDDHDEKHDGHEHGDKKSDSHDDHEDHEGHGKHDGHNEHGHDEHKKESQKEKHEDHDGHGHDEHGEESVRLDEKALQEFNIVVHQAGPGTLEQFIPVPGEIVANRDNVSHISPRFAGIVKEVHKNIGDSVKAGEMLAVIESNESLTAYQLKALVDGTIIEKHITRGEMLSEDDVAFVIADLSTVWINLSVYQTDLPLVRTGQDVHLSLGHHQPEMIGKISYVSPIVEEQTRTAVARVVLPNPDGTWRPGLFVTADILVRKKPVSLLIPKTAIETVEGKPSVFIKTDNGFKPQPIKIGNETDEFAEVLAGLTPGQPYVSKHGFTLKAELMKGSFGHGGHAH